MNNNFPVLFSGGRNMSVNQTSPNLAQSPLLATRFFVPVPPAAYISRQRLRDRLDQGLQAPVTLVSAPPGFGKSTLLSDWIKGRMDLHAAWLSLETSDTNWELFFRYLISAWQHIFPDAGEAALAELNAFSAPNYVALANLLLNDLLAGQDTVGSEHSIMVLDDYHRIESTSIHETVVYLIEHLPPLCHLVLLTRANPPFPVARWRSLGKIVEIREDDLRFSSEESAEYLNQIMRLGLSEEQVGTLQTRTEGWIVGLKMAALSLQGRKDPLEFVHDFGGSNRFVVDYLVEEVIRQQPEEIQHFLLATALLDQFSAPLCDALLETAAPYSQKMLECLEKSNLFLIALDDHRQWFRYHHLFADLLRVRLQQTDPVRISAILRLAAAWFADQGLWREAIAYALKGKNFDLGADLIERAIFSLGRQFLFGGLQALIDPFPLGLVQARPLLSLVKAVVMIEISQISGIEPFLRTAEEGVRTTAPSSIQNELLGAIYIVRSWAAVLLGDSPRTKDACEQVSRLLPRDVKAKAEALTNLGNAYYFEGKLHLLDDCWQQALELRLSTGDTYTSVDLMESYGRICCHKGELQRAEDLFKHALQLLAREHDRYPRLLGAIERDYSDLLRERNQMAEAHAMMTHGLPLNEQWGFISGRGLGYLHMSRILHAEGDLAGARAMLAKAQDLCRKYTVYPDLEDLVKVFHARLFLEAGQPEQAWHALETCLQADCCRNELRREWMLIAQARVLAQTGRPTEALELLSGRLESAKENGRGRNWLEICLLTALALKANGDQHQAQRTLKEGLAYAQAEGFRRIFVDEGEPMRGLLEEFRVLFPQSGLSDFVCEILAIFPAPSFFEYSHSIKNERLVEPLSVRELDILHLVIQGFSNSEIAGRLVLSVGTVKTHIHNIYGKLGVRDRPQAIAKASLLGL
jgi:LuxR family transcriptional regulator, maltose regulon positive regulatory protein